MGVIDAHPDIEELPDDEDATPNGRNRCELLQSRLGRFVDHHEDRAEHHE